MGNTPRAAAAETGRRAAKLWQTGRLLRGRPSPNRRSSPAGTFQNPLLAENCPDPAVLRVGRSYYLYCTSGNAPNAYPIRRSDDLVHWTPAGWIFPAGRRPAWARSDFWAPEVHRVGRRYVAYFTARDRSRRLCIGVAWAETPAGPWHDSGAPLVRNDRVGMIDSHYFQDRDGRRYLYWKQDGNDLRPMERTPIYAQELAPDGLSLVGQPHPVLQNDRDWEGDLVEGPWVVRRGRYYYLFYSGNNFWEADYAVGVARATSPLGPFFKSEETLLRRDENWLGPGHGRVVRGADGADYFV
ncbi:MAG TPA: glycoside hydrolase family 43 protein, partial [Armatimonadota bacterium]|nr:glycoside hydrolase family 43 protein [Armatimonadota bacterium]